jgi:hypothetical protein
MQRSLWKTFRADLLGQHAVQMIIARHFSCGTQPTAREVVYPGDGEPAIILRFDKDDDLIAIEEGPAITPTLRAQITLAADNALIDDGTRVFRQFRFADHKLTGSWRYDDRFQITPVPPNETPSFNTTPITPR